MKINEKILSVPPFISTTWTNISAIMMKASGVAITLKDGDTIHIPGLEKEIIDLIFKTHAEQIEKNCFHDLNVKKNSIEAENRQLSILSQMMLSEAHQGESSLKFGFATLDGFNTVMQHNPLEMNAPDLPKVLLEKIGSIAKIIVPDETQLLPKEVQNCNCFHCQITRTINESIEKEMKVTPANEEIISDLELQFSQWHIDACGDNLFTITNKLDKDEQYTVSLNSPVSCNCGKENCEHIEAALRT